MENARAALPETDMLLEMAEKEAQLSDWGPLPFLEPLRRVIESIREEGRLRPDALDRMKGGILASLKTRLRLQDVHRRNPQLAARPIAAPIIIVGLPRSGTTNLHSLLAQDPAHRVARTWEVTDPFPAVTAEAYWSDPRIETVQQLIASRGMLAEEIQAVLPYHATSPAECGAIIDHAFMSQYRQSAARSPSWSLWRDREADWSAAFEFHRQFLQHLQTHYAGDRWLLKSPEHLVPAEALGDTYPDAVIIHTHRDPAKVLGSVSSLFVALRKLNSDAVDPVEVGREQFELWAHATDCMLAARDKWAASRTVIDVHLADVARAPIETAEAIYARIGIPFSDAARSAMEGFLSGDESAREHKHNYRSSYDLKDFGLSAGEIHERFGDYMNRFGITP